MAEHILQRQIKELLEFNKIVFFETDVMDGLKFCKTQKERLTFISHHLSMGYQKGQSDLVLVLPNKIYFVELKDGKKGVQSKDQKIFQQTVEALGHPYLLWRSIDDCLDFIHKVKSKS